MQKERWKAAPDFEGFYEVSNHGRVRRIAPAAKLPASKLPYILIGSHDERGYPQVLLSMHGKSFGRKVHRLVALAFIGPRPSGLQINHIDGDKKNNLVDNLEYVTPKYNTIHGYTFDKRRAACPRGENHPNHVLTECAVHVIRDRTNKVRHLMKRFGISKATVDHVRSRRSWKHVLP